MKTVAMADVRARFARYLKASLSEPVVVTRKGKPVAVLVGVTEGDEDQKKQKKPLRLSDILDAAEARFAAGKGIPHDEFWRIIDERYGGNDKSKKKPR